MTAKVKVGIVLFVLTAVAAGASAHTEGHLLVAHQLAQAIHLMAGRLNAVLKAESPGIDQRSHRDIKGAFCIF